MKSVKCWKTEACEITSYVFARTRGKARAATLHTARDAGFRLTFPEIRCRRCRIFDGMEQYGLETNRPYSLEIMTHYGNTIASRARTRSKPFAPKSRQLKTLFLKRFKNCAL